MEYLVTPDDSVCRMSAFGCEDYGIAWTVCNIIHPFQLLQNTGYGWHLHAESFRNFFCMSVSFLIDQQSDGLQIILHTFC